MNQAIAGLRSNEALIRVGHFSHVECVTLDGVRQPRTRMGRDRRPLPWGKTRTLANEIYPFGWIKLEFLDLESKPGARKDWPFPLDAEPDVKKAGDFRVFFQPPKVSGGGAPYKKEKSPAPESGKPAPERKPSAPALPPLEKLIKEMKLLKPNAMGPLGTIMQKIETLETDQEKAAMAEAFRAHIGPKAFKKHKKKGYLMALIQKVDKST